MTGTAKRLWIDPLRFALGCRPGFAEAMATQLAAQALIEHALELERDFSLMPSERVPTIHVTDDGISTVEVDLLGPDGQGAPAVIAWSDTRRHTAVAPSASTDEHQDISLRFWWHEFPPDDELEHYRSPAPLAETSARIIWRVIAWPDVELRLALESEPSSRWIDISTAIVQNAVNRWNAQDGAGRIHHWTLPERLPSGEYAIRVDFGSAPEAALGTLLDELDTLSAPSLRHITVCAPGAR